MYHDLPGDRTDLEKIPNFDRLESATFATELLARFKALGAGDEAREGLQPG